ncbi:MAG: hypothetical protein JWO60_1411 [Frankiales bacterium]|nr:hypothetical protein [Frankiales bacterium]
MRTSSLPRVGTALLVSVLAGLLVAGVAFPVVGGLGLAAKAGADDFLELPAGLTSEQPPTRTRMLDADGGLIATLYLENRVNVVLGQVPEHVQKAVIAIEDARFYEHNGVDVKGTVRAAVNNTAGGGTQGGSTLTQQYVKNALIASASAREDKAGQQAAVEQSVQRKLREARYALAIEKQLSKDEILTRYLNIAYFGNGAYGIAAAAQFYFGKPVQKLTIAQGAMLAGMVQNPTKFDPTDTEKAPGVLVRRNLVLKRMADLGFIDETTRAQGSGLILGLDVHPVGNGCESEPVGAAAFFCDYVRKELETTDVGKALGDTLQEKQRRMFSGLTIRTTLDRDVLKAAQEAVEARVPVDGQARSAVDVVEPGTGHIKAMAVNQVYGEKKGQTKVNFAVGGNYGFQGGSTFKAFVLANAIQQGIPLSTSFYSPQKYTSKEFPNYGPNGPEPYTISNAEAFESGTYDLTQATHESINTYYLQLMEKTGVDGPAGLAAKLGVKRIKDENDKSNVPLQRGGSFVLGASEVSPLAMAGAYAAFAARGTFCKPQAVLSVTDNRGKAIPIPEPQCDRVLEPAVADTVNQVLRGVVQGPGPRTGGDAQIGRDVAGKTGTTNSSRAAWFIGYTPQLATAVWVGLPDEKGAPTAMRRVTIGGRYYRQVYGGTVPAAVFRLTMREALKDEPELRFDRPDADALPDGEDGQEATGTVPDLRGLSRSEARRALRAAGFQPVDGGRARDADYVERGQVAYSSPGRGDPAAPGSTVTIFVRGG